MTERSHVVTERNPEGIKGTGCTFGEGTGHTNGRLILTLKEDYHSPHLDEGTGLIIARLKHTLKANYHSSRFYVEPGLPKHGF